MTHDPDPSDAPLPPLAAARARLRPYLEALLEIGVRVNLTAAASPGAAREILVEPSLAVAGAWSAPAGPRCAVDIGSGNGFPGVAVASLWPDCRVVLVERRAKKARAIQACLVAAGLANAEVVACDARELRRERPDLLGAADLVTLRAVTSIEEGDRLAAPLLARGGRIVHWKRAATPKPEVEAGEARARALGLAVHPPIPHGVDGLLVIHARPGAGPAA